METSYEAIVLCGGETYDVTSPKPLLKLGKWNLLEYQVRWLMAHGIKHCVLASDQEYKIRHSFDDYIDWCIESFSKGTGGAVMSAVDYLKDDKPFYVMNVDDICLGYNPVSLIVPETQARVLVGKPRLRYGIANLRRELVLGFKEKPFADFYASAGHYCFKRHIIDRYFPDDGNLEDKVLPKLAHERILENVRIHKWYSIDTMRDYKEVRLLLEQGNYL